MITVIDYGMGNLASVKNGFNKLGYKVLITDKADEVLKAEKVVLPGVGAFADAVSNLQKLGLDKAIKEVIAKGVPFLGICLGMQLLLSASYEDGLNEGLNIVKGKVIKFTLPPSYKVPHMGWNAVKKSQQSRLFKGIADNSYFYFVHSYHAIPEDESWVAGRTEYGITFVSALEKDNVFATQFHPEKSGETGLKILRNFGEM
ncbi:imidazole glycerol phosphate synthase subunit hisH [Thermosyntropha lipolytica DSM 11003]|uniref:Imidazole glycerol phosphate synthase subunit HisH n=1 Tax=Thermosyntropha lipolytica DSM 11003 TaxID=1123382 RepID=A0A1M5J8Q8_9FIRM|nr:imidazole glycerol phosphate synthase subunit HisH [Thermosyntropha lipolytica]SHG36996.1 imidazole glycerol phosphate synthase subunit hisH [Thermosyntropha lipolytica DSM 11003]